MSLKYRIWKYLKGLLILMAMVLTISLQSCILEDGLDSANIYQEDETESYYIQFLMNPGDNSLGRSRAVGDDGFDSDHPDEENLAAESYITVDDMRIFLFNTNGFFLQELIPEFTLNQPGIFSAKLLVRSESFADRDGNVEFSLVVLANWESIGGTYPVLIPMQSTLSQLEKTSEYAFTQDPTWTPSFSSDQRSNKGIPMYGHQVYKGMSLDMLKSTSKDNPLKLYSDGSSKTDYQKDIKLLRSLAKFEIADNIEKINGDYPKVVGVGLINYRKNGLFIPHPDTFKDGFNQVFAPSLPSLFESGNDIRELNPVKAYRTGLSGDFGDEWSQKFRSGWFSTYLPEMVYTPSSQNGFTLSVDVQMNADQSSVETKTVAVPGFKLSGTNEEGTILRNHIYRIEVNMQVEQTQETEITLVYGICPWVEKTINIPPFD